MTTRVFRNLITALKTAIIACPVATDRGAPARFREETNTKIEMSPLDRGFVIESSPPTVLNYINLPGKVTCRIGLRARFSYVNERRSETDALALVSEDSERLTQYLFFAIRAASITGLNTWNHDGDATIEAQAEGSRKTLSIPFYAIYYDDAVTS